MARVVQYAFMLHLKMSNRALEEFFGKHELPTPPPPKGSECAVDQNLLLLPGNGHNLMGRTGHLKEKGTVAMS